ncbi:Pimeloyl-ACP methyl ester carboxylesterase [Halogranum gelatinilyticum]|uniref:Pimeloyl-ACP methyl ester carboxylesterase n=1 Tax=Halogranum gelatinilyticum TaxID=660521 RepID=A0A1G9T8G7_9EURY|nr:alpha/beta hydrolase [Halogranum gelatinilyticum]SDM43947.1 Pimeloyl-ACP methyl ester carboxylesterase [Halogranum gelatinilyticum]
MALTDAPLDSHAADVCDGRAVVDGQAVTYAEYGAPDGDPVVFLHGTPGSRLLGALFHEAARDRGVRVLAPDRPGYGGSPPWPDRTLADTGHVVAAVLSDAGVDTAGLVGFSGGGPHALAAAATRDDLVTAVDVVAGALPPDARTTTPAPVRLFERLATTTPRLLGGLLRVQALVAARASPSLVVSQYAADPDSVADEVAALVARDFVEALETHRQGFVRETRLLADDWDVSLGDVDGPARLWYGGADTNVGGDAAALGRRLPAAQTTTFPEADHLGTLLRSREPVLDRYATE